MNKRHPYRDMEREYLTTDISIRELCRRHGITAHSLVTVQARKGKWQERREAHQAKASDAYIERYAARQADRQAEIHDKALDAIDEGITRFREDLKATEKKLVDGEWIDVPVCGSRPGTWPSSSTGSRSCSTAHPASTRDATSASARRSPSTPSTSSWS